MDNKLKLLVYESERTLKNYDTWDSNADHGVSMILGDDKSKDYVVLLYNSDDLAIIHFRQNNANKVDIVSAWAYDIDENELALLRDNYQIKYLDSDLIKYYWGIIGYNYADGALNHVDGLKKFYDYCKNNKITDREINLHSKFDVKKYLKEQVKKNKNAERGDR